MSVPSIFQVEGTIIKNNSDNYSRNLLSGFDEGWTMYTWK